MATLKMRTFLKYWVPALAWMALIFAASSDLMSAQHTSRFIGPFLRWIMPEVSPPTIQSVQFAVRKAAHVTEYAILAALLLRALRVGARLRLRDAIISVAAAMTCAALDEYHQSFVASRTGSAGDVLIDSSGAILGAALCWWAISRRRRIRGAENNDATPAADIAS